MLLKRVFYRQRPSVCLTCLRLALSKMWFYRFLSQLAILVAQKDPHPGRLEWGRQLQWGPRLGVTQASLPARAPLLELRRRLAAIAGQESFVGAAWLQQAKLCRAAGLLALSLSLSDHV